MEEYRHGSVYRELTQPTISSSLVRMLSTLSPAITFVWPGACDNLNNIRVYPADGDHTMRKQVIILLSIALTPLFNVMSTSASEVSDNVKANACPTYLNHEFKRLHSSETVNLCHLYKGKPIIVVNTASHCGYTPQFKGLEALYEKYKEQGVEVIGFASDDFKQGAKNEEEAATICYKNYGVTFTMLSPTHVKGDQANPVFAHLNEQADKPSWNFNKYLISSDGKDVKRFGSNTKPMNSKLEKALQQAL